MRLIWLVVALTCGFIRVVQSKSSWSLITRGRCQFTANNGFTVQFNVHPSLFIDIKKAANLTACHHLCCFHDTCNGYVWSNRDKQENCKLLKCSSEGQDCKNALTVAAVGVGQVGFVTGYSAEPPAVWTTYPPSVSKPLNKASTPEKTTTVHKDNKSTNGKQNNLLNAVPKNSNWLLQRFNDMAGDEHSKEPVQQTKPSSHPILTLTSIPVAREVSTALPKMSSAANRAPYRAYSSHTDTVSLAVASFIGFGFMVTVLFMIGRRWMEGIKDWNKREYTRISYLLNGV